MANCIMCKRESDRAGTHISETCGLECQVARQRFDPRLYASNPYDYYLDRNGFCRKRKDDTVPGGVS
ncbi:MAG: hypothetical protein ACXADH_15490 [Candidatus Kariarchaeaceae archaeon]|jgi:hypothetical protein